MSNYDSKNVSVIIDGHFVTGFHDGTFVSVEKNNDNFTEHVGAQGDVTFSENADGSGTITFTVKQTSTSLPYLQKLSKRKDTYSARVIDANDGSFKAGGNEARIRRTPGREFGSEVAGVEVQVYVADYDAK